MERRVTGDRWTVEIGITLGDSNLVNSVSSLSVTVGGREMSATFAICKTTGGGLVRFLCIRGLLTTSLTIGGSILGLAGIIEWIDDPSNPTSTLLNIA
jgi:hypothetical protein